MSELDEKLKSLEKELLQLFNTTTTLNDEFQLALTIATKPINDIYKAKNMQTKLFSEIIQNLKMQIEVKNKIIEQQKTKK